MFCKHCGQKLDPSNPICPKCGTKVSMSGGNGFWDMAGEQNHQTVPPVKEKVVIKEVKKPAIIPIAICAALCLVCLIIMIAGQVSARKTIQELSSDYETRIGQLNQQKTNYEDQVRELETRIATLENELDKSEEPQIPVKVLRSPTSETKPEGFVNLAGSWLFGFVIEGEAVEVRWEKQQDDGTWIALEFNSHDKDTRFGLKIEQNLKEGSSKLVADGLTSESAGKYKCTVLTDHGSESVEVQLTLEPIYIPNSSSESDDDKTLTTEEEELIMAGDISVSSEDEYLETPSLDDNDTDLEKGQD